VKFWPLILLLPSVALAQDDPIAVDDWEEDWGDEEQGIVWSGFLEAGLGTRFRDDTLVGSNNTLEDIRWRIESEWRPDRYTIGLKADLGYDGIENEGFANIRDLSVGFTVGESTDVAVGRQVQTWGTGDLVFLNDLFPKDFQSFFSGRDDEYLKAPGDAIRLTRYSPKVNVDFVWTPVFENDVYLTGERYSFFSPIAGDNVAPGFTALEPDKSLANGEFALRLFRTIGGREYALYAYRGFFKQPSALTTSFEPTFAPMSAIGASFRRPAGPGLFNAEVSYYDSRDDRSGTNPLIPNDQLRLLAGFEWEAKPNFTVGLQYYVEWTLDHDELMVNSPFPQYAPDEQRHLITNRLTWRVGMDKYTWSLFTFYSPSDDDFYLRPQLTYRHSDQWSLSAGGNLFGGDTQHTFFNQLQDASNAYLRLRYHY
jgi:hypothetical protein